MITGLFQFMKIFFDKISKKIVLSKVWEDSLWSIIPKTSRNARKGNEAMLDKLIAILALLDLLLLLLKDLRSKRK